MAANLQAPHSRYQLHLHLGHVYQFLTLVPRGAYKAGPLLLPIRPIEYILLKLYQDIWLFHRAKLDQKVQVTGRTKSPEHIPKNLLPHIPAFLNLDG